MTKLQLKPELIRLKPDQRLYQCPVPLVGLTGGVATGKSTVASLLINQGLHLINADALIKYIYTSKEALRFVAEHFPQAIKDQTIFFPLLRELAFSHPEVKESLENFLYPKLPFAFYFFYNEFEEASFVVYDVPLLFEKSLERFFDLIICVTTNETVQKERLMQRDGIDEKLADRMIASQLSLRFKTTKADYVVENSKDKKTLKKNVDRLLQTITFQQ